MAEMNPLQILGMVNQFQQKPTENKALRDLQTKSSIMSQQQSGANARNTANLGNAMKVAAFNKDIGLSPQESMVGGSFSPSTLGRLRTTRGLGDALLGGQAIDAFRSGGVGLEDPKKAFLPKDVPFQSLIGGFPTKAEAAAIAEATIKAKKGRQVQYTKRDPNKGFSKVTDTDEVQQQAKTKNTPEAIQRARQIDQIITDRFARENKRAEVVTPYKEGDKFIMISVDGGPPQRFPVTSPSKK